MISEHQQDKMVHITIPPLNILKNSHTDSIILRSRKISNVYTLCSSRLKLQY